MEVEPLAGKRHVAVTQHRTGKDWATQIKQMLDERYPDAIKVRLVMDNLNTHSVASFDETFEPGEASMPRVRSTGWYASLLKRLNCHPSRTSRLRH
jgi:hypothetical protein